MKSRISKYFILLSIFILHFSILNCREDWAQIYAPSSVWDWWAQYYPDDLILTSDGGIATIGWYWYWDDEYQDQFGYLLKTDGDGNVIWTAEDTIFPAWTYPTAIIETSDNGLLTSGHFENTNYGLGYLIKRDSEGSLQWSSILPYRAYTMCVTTDTDIVIPGWSYEDDINHIEIRKYTSDGDTVWARNYDYLLEVQNPNFDNLNYAKIRSVCATSDGGSAFIMNRYYYYEPPPSLYNDLLVVKIDAEGDTLWTRHFDINNGVTIAHSIIQLSDNNLFVSIGSGSFHFYKLSQAGETVLDVIIPDVPLPYSVVENSSGQIVGHTEHGWEAHLDIYSPEGEFISTFDTGSLFASYVSIERSVGITAAGNYITVGEDTNHYVRLAMFEDITSAAGNEIIDVPEVSMYCYPNPFNPETTIKFSIPEDSKVKLTVYNIKGQKVKTLINDNLEKGIHEVIWAGKNSNNKSVASGVYFYKFDVNNKTKSVKKCLLLK